LNFTIYKALNDFQTIFEIDFAAMIIS